ncbi:MAG: dockerin type I repeat-containing protein [Bacteroidaceae bacterium]|nr:dockerin type I repeat-containing protein [Bacteroidaceae bacterium]
MRKGTILITCLLLSNGVAFAQEGPVFSPNDAKTVFVQDFEQDWDSWTQMIVDTISNVTYYNRLGSGSVSNANIYNGSWDWDIYGTRDTLILMRNGVVVTTFKSDYDIMANECFGIQSDRSVERDIAFKQFGEFGGDNVFQYISDNAVGSSSYSNGAVPKYCRNLFVRGLPIEANSSYRLTLYVKAKQLGAIEPAFYADVMRGYFNSEKPFSMANSNTSFEYEKKEFTGDWEKVTFMTYYTNDSIADGFFYSNGYWWGDDLWTWREGENEHNFIKQPDKFFVRLSFASDSTIFEVDNITLTKSTIGGVEYYNDKLRVDFGYQTNLAQLAMAQYVDTHIDAVELPGEYFEVWGFSSTGQWEEIPIRSAEYHGDGYMYMFTESIQIGAEEYPVLLNEYEKVLVSFRNPVNDYDLCLRYNGNLYPNSDNEEWVASGKPVFDFSNEEAKMNPYVFKGVYSMKELPPVLQEAPYEEGSFGLDGSTRELYFKFSREVMIDDQGIESYNLVALVGSEVWIPSWDQNSSCLIITRPDKYTSPLAGDYDIKLLQIIGMGTPYGDDVILHYHFGEYDRVPETSLIVATDWRNDGNENQSVPKGITLWDGKTNFAGGQGTGSNIGSKSRLYYTDPDQSNGWDCGMYFSSRGNSNGGHLFYGYDENYPLSLSKGNYALNFSAANWDGYDGCPVTIYIYPKDLTSNPQLDPIDESLKNKIATFQPTITASSSNVQVYSEPYGVWDNQEYSFAFNVPADGDYVIEWMAAMGPSGNAKNYGGAMMSNFSISNGGNLSYVPVSNLNKSVQEAEALADMIAPYSQYHGDDYNLLLAYIQYYRYDGSFTSTSPLAWEEAKYYMDYIVYLMNRRILDVDQYNMKLNQISEILSMYSIEYGALQAYVTLSGLYQEYSAYELSSKMSEELNVAINALEAFANELANRIALNEKFNAQIDRGIAVLEAGYESQNEEYAMMQTALNNAMAFDGLGATDDELIAETSTLKKAIDNYAFREQNIEVKTRGLKDLAVLGQYLGVRFPDGIDLYSQVLNATDYDDTLALVLKAAIKVAVYEWASNNNEIVDGLDVSSFMRNNYLYQTPKVVERTDKQMPTNANDLSQPDPDGAQIQLVQHQWNSGDLNGKLPIWVMILNQEFTDLIPGWSVMAPNSGGNRMVTGDKTYQNYIDGVPVFDGEIAMDWNSTAYLSTTVTDLPAGIYSIGVDLNEYSGGSKGAYLTAFTDVDSYSVMTSENGAQLLAVNDVEVTLGTMYLEFVLNSGDGWSRADNFQLHYQPLGDYDYAAALVEAQAELDGLLGYVGPDIPVDPLKDVKEMLRNCIDSVYLVLSYVNDDIYRGQDYDRLQDALFTALEFESQDEYRYYALADTLTAFCYEMYYRKDMVDSYIGMLKTIAGQLKREIDYSYLDVYMDLSDLYQEASAIDIPSTSSAILDDYCQRLYLGYATLADSIKELPDTIQTNLFKIYLPTKKIECETGNRIEIPVSLRNTKDVTAFSFSMALPYGFTLVDAYLDSDRMNGHQLSYNVTEQGYYLLRLASMSESNLAFYGNDGEIVNLIIDVDEQLEDGQYGISFINTEITVTPTEYYSEASDLDVCYVNVSTPYFEPGDVNDDGVITITDAVGVVSFIIKSNVDGLNRRAADANQDGIIDVADAVWIVNVVIGKNNNAQVRGYVPAQISSTLNVDDATIAPNMSIPVRLNGMANEVTAIQFDMTLPDGVSVDAIKTDKSHSIITGKQEDGTYNVVCLSLSNSTFAGGGDAALTLELTSDNTFEGGQVILDNAKVVTPDCRQKSLYSLSSNIENNGGQTFVPGVTDDSEYELYDLQGRSTNNTGKAYILDGKIMMKVK